MSQKLNQFTKITLQLTTIQSMTSQDEEWRTISAAQIFHVASTS